MQNDLEPLVGSRRRSADRFGCVRGGQPLGVGCRGEGSLAHATSRVPDLASGSARRCILALKANSYRPAGILHAAIRPHALLIASKAAVIAGSSIRASRRRKFGLPMLFQRPRDFSMVRCEVECSCRSIRRFFKFCACLVFATNNWQTYKIYFYKYTYVSA
jgi:hypothetical protein